MDVTLTTLGNAAEIRLAGRFDFAAHMAFRKVIDPVLCRNELNSICFDMSDVDYVDSSALGMLLMVRDRVRRRTHEGQNPAVIKIANVQPAPRRVLDIANFSRLFEME